MRIVLILQHIQRVSAIDAESESMVAKKSLPRRAIRSRKLVQPLQRLGPDQNGSATAMCFGMTRPAPEAASASHARPDVERKPAGSPEAAGSPVHKRLLGSKRWRSHKEKDKTYRAVADEEAHTLTIGAILGRGAVGATPMPQSAFPEHTRT
jgi:hypothetical protein